MKSIILLFFLLISIKNEKWYGEITGYDINNKDKYAGTSGIKITHFYLCGNREYYIHRLGDPWNIWSNKYVGCQPAGNGVPIDGICIVNGKYRARLTNGNWLKEISRCNIVENNGETFAGQIGETISSIAIDGGDVYSVATGSDSPDKEVCAINVFKNLFGCELSFKKENEVLRFRAGIDLVVVELIKEATIIQDGEITFMIENREIKGFKWNKKIEKNEIEVNVEKITGIKPKKFKMKITEAFKNGMLNGYVSISFDIINKSIKIEAITKINAKRLIFGGGFRITIILGDENRRKFMYAFSKFPSLLPEKEKKELKKYPDFPRIPIFEFDKFFSQTYYTPNINSDNQPNLILIIFGILAIITASLVAA